MDEASGTFDNNTIQTVSQDIQNRFTGSGSVAITNNNINGGGVEIAEQNAGAGTFTISGNTFNGTFGSTYTSALRLKNNTQGKTTTVSGNTFTGHNWGISLENYRAVTVNNNVFTPASGSTTYRHITVNTKELSSSSGTFQPNIDGTFINNTFNGSGGTGGLGLAFYNEDNNTTVTPGPSPVFGTFTIGTSGNENNFNAGVGTFIYLDNNTGITSYPAPIAQTTRAPFPVNLDATNNKFDVGAGLELPSAMSLANLFSLEDKVQHKPDTLTLGFVLVKANNDYITTNSFVAPSTAPSVQRGVDAASTGFTVNVANGVYNGDVNVNKSVTLRGQSQSAVIRGLYAGNSKSVIVSAPGVTVKNVTITRDYGTTFAEWAASNKTEGIIVENVSNFTLDSALVTGNRNGVYIHSVPGFVVKNSIVRDNRTGFQVWGNLDNGQVINNFITNNFTHGFLVNFEQGFTTANNLLVNNNNISGNWYSQINFQNSGAPGTNVGSFAGSNFNCNWYGTTNPDYAAVNAGGVGYTTQVPSQFGGTDPGVNADIRGQEAALITYVPYLTSGADNNAPDSLDGFNPLVPCVACTALNASVAQTATTCNGFNNGELTVTVSDPQGVTPYRYVITSGPTVNTTGESSGIFTGLSQGTYNITVFQANGCSTALAPVTVKDQIAPTFSTCPAPVTGQPVTMSGCQASVDPPDPVATDNCTSPGVVVTYTLSGATSGSGTAPIGLMNFNAGTTTITYTATDQSGNTATCVTSVEVVNNLKDSISGTATVVQNNATTSNITFYGSGGTKPYSFTYNVSFNGGAPGPNQTVSTSGTNDIVTVPQSNAVVGQYIYTLVSGTDAFGCPAAIASDNKDTITVTATSTRPDFVSSVPRPANAAFVNGQVKEGYVTVTNVSTVPSTGQITFRISNVANFSFSFPANMSSVATGSGPETVNNSDWIITPGAFFYTVTSKPGVFISGGTFSRVGFIMTATGNSGSQGIMTVTILNDTGGSSVGAGDDNSTNNQSVKLFTIN